MSSNRTAIVVLAALATGCTPAVIGPKITREGFISCSSEEALREWIHAEATADQRYIDFLLRTLVCYERPGATKVTAVDWGVIFQDMQVFPWVKYRTFAVPPFRDIYPTPSWTHFDALEDPPSTELAETLDPDSPEDCRQFGFVHALRDGRVVTTHLCEEPPLEAVHIISDGKVVEDVPTETGQP